MGWEVGNSGNWPIINLSRAWYLQEDGIHWIYFHNRRSCWYVRRPGKFYDCLLYEMVQIPNDADVKALRKAVPTLLRNAAPPLGGWEKSKCVGNEPAPQCLDPDPPKPT